MGPIYISNHIPEFGLADSTNESYGHKLHWACLQQTDIKNYCKNNEELLKLDNIPVEALACRDVYCNNTVHINALDKSYSEKTVV